MTYSIVARDAVTGELGAAVQTRWLAAGAGVLWVEPGVGAVATQSFVEAAHGYHGLERLRAGEDAATVLPALLAPDADESVRQVGIVDARGGSAAHTGSRCVPHAGHLTTADVAVQANMMERATVWPAMLQAFETTHGDLADRLVAALRAAEAEGGDVRGRQSAALIVAPGRVGADAWERRFDLRVDDHRAPLDELERLLRLNRAYEAFERSEELGEAGDAEGAFACTELAHDLAPDDDMVALWHAVSLVRRGRVGEARELFARASRAEPRSGEHLRRFNAAGHLRDADLVLDALGQR